MTQPMIPHRGAVFEALFERVQIGLRSVFRTARPVMVSSSSATGLMEASLRCAPAGRVLAVVNGAFAERYAQTARACGREVEELTIEWGCAPDPEAVERRLAGNRFAVMTVVHSETSTGALADVRAMTAAAHRQGALCLVDSVTGVGGAPLEFDAWEMDFVLTGSQKALALPPGLAFGAMSEEYVSRMADAPPGRGIYFDLAEFAAYAARDQTPNTPALPQLYALDDQLAAIAAEGVEGRWARHAAMAETTWRWAEARRDRGIEVLAPVGARSPTVSALTLPNDVKGAAVVGAMGERGYVIGNGYGRLKDRTVRIGHMGDHTVTGVRGCLEVLDAVLGVGME